MVDIAGIALLVAIFVHIVGSVSKACGCGRYCDDGGRQ
jgi:hypothetical protein